MPRVKHTLTGKEVIEAWMNQSQDWARNSSGSIRFEGPFLYNDRDKCFERRELGNGHVLWIRYSYNQPSYRAYSADGYSTGKLLERYIASDHQRHLLIECAYSPVYVGLMNTGRENIPYYYRETREQMEAKVSHCVERNFTRLHNVRTFLHDAGVTSLGQLGDLNLPSDNAISMLGDILFGKLDAMRYFRMDSSYTYRGTSIDKAFGDGALDTMLLGAISRHSHILHGEVSGGCEYANFWSNI